MGVMNADLDPVEPVMQESYVFQYVIMFFMIVTNWAIFSILTAVVSDNMNSVTEESEKDSKEDEDKHMREKRRETLGDIFDKLDTDHSGDISEHKFRCLL